MYISLLAERGSKAFFGVLGHSVLGAPFCDSTNRQAPVAPGFLRPRMIWRQPGKAQGGSLRACSHLLTVVSMLPLLHLWQGVPVETWILPNSLSQEKTFLPVIPLEDLPPAAASAPAARGAAAAIAPLTVSKRPLNHSCCFLSSPSAGQAAKNALRRVHSALASLGSFLLNSSNNCGRNDNTEQCGNTACSCNTGINGTPISSTRVAFVCLLQEFPKSSPATVFLPCANGWIFTISPLRETLSTQPLTNPSI